MNQIVTYQLQRAVQSNQTSSLARHAEVAPVVEKIVAALQKVYADKAMKVELNLDRQALFAGDERDLLELLGNVLDNAFKYGKSRLCVDVECVSAKLGDIVLAIADDGAGIADDKIEFVLQRGARADTLAQGQGIGLAVVTDIVSSYDGKIAVSRSELGGALIKISFS